ncbi:MAG: GDP-fucose synthetase [Deltaproteobacteria bacterium]|nr:GDP-fucose synthetase [Deltaproteobacteria bacterium]
MRNIFVAGHEGMVGSAICRELKKYIDVKVLTKRRAELDLTNQTDVHGYLAAVKPDEIIIAAAKVGGIFANQTYPAEFIYSNVQIQTNLIHGAHLAGIKKLLFLGSSCIYPKFAEQPMVEASILTGALEPTNEPYAIAKILGIKMCESYSRQYGCDYRSVMPTNIYGPNDNFHNLNSHVVPALIRKFHNASVRNETSVTVWGSGSARREFIFVDDVAEACVFVMQKSKKEYGKFTKPMQSHVNVGTGVDITIKDLVKLIKKVVGFEGQVLFDHDKQEGAPVKLLDVSMLNKMGWSSTTELAVGLEKTYQWFMENLGSQRLRL